MNSITLLAPNSNGGYDPKQIQIECQYGISVDYDDYNRKLRFNIDAQAILTQASHFSGSLHSQSIIAGPENSFLSVKQGKTTWVTADQFVADNLNQFLDNPAIRDRIENVLSARKTLEDAQRNLDMTIKLAT